MADSNTLGGFRYVESFDDVPHPSKIDPDDALQRRFFGKYRGTVLQNIDPEGRGRLLVQVAEVWGLSTSSWALPCLPSGGLLMGMYLIPPMKAKVWIEFEHGDPDYPIWVGCWWGSLPEPPATAKLTTPGAPVILMQSIAQSKMVISDTPIPPMQGPGILLQAGPSYIAIDPTGVTIFGPKIFITGLTNVNNGALTVTA